MYLYLIRHGESEGNRLNKIQGWQDFPLSSLGKKQASHLGKYFKTIELHHIYTSDLMRAHDTAQAIGNEKGLSVKRWESLREIKLGPLEGKSKEEIYLDFPEVKERSILTSGVEGTESVEEITERCKQIIEQLLDTHENDHVALIAHGGLISILLMYILLGDDWYKHHRPFQVGNTGISLIEWNKGKKPLIHYLNADAHLPRTGLN